MTKQVAQITRIGDLKTNGIVREGAAPINSNLVHDIDLTSDVCSDIRYGSDSPMAVPTQTAMRSDNLLDAFGLDWRNPENWSGGDVSTIKYNEKEDCLEVTSPRTMTLRSGMIPILHNNKFNISLDAWQSHIADAADQPIIYVGGSIFAKDGTTNLSSEQIPGTYDYFAVSGKRPSSGWTTYTNNHGGGAPRSGIDGIKSNSAGWVSDASRYYRPLILANYSGTTGDVVKIRNLRYWYSDDITEGQNEQSGAGLRISNTSLTNYATRSNLGTSGSGSGWYGVSAPRSVTYLPDGTHGTKVHLVQDREHADFLATGRGDGHRMGGIGLGTWATVPASDNPAGEWYTAAMLVRSSDWSKVSGNQFYFNHKPTDSDKRVGWSGFSNSRKVHVGNGWYFCYVERQMPSNTNDFYVGTYNYKLNHQLEFGKMTLVKGRVATLLAPNQTTVNDSVTMKTQSLSEFTVIGHCINSTAIGNNISYSDGVNNQSALFSLQGQDGKWFHFRHWLATSGTVSMPFIDPDNSSVWNTSSTSSNHRHTTMSLATGQELYWVVKHRPNGPVYVQFYNADGTQYSNFNNLPASILDSPTLEAIKLGTGSNNWEALHLGVQVYDTYVDNAGITDIIKTRLAVHDGELNEHVSETRNNTNLIPVDMSPYDNHKFGSGWASVKSITNYLPENDPITGWHLGTAGSGTKVTTAYGIGVKLSAQDSIKTTVTTSSHYRYIDVPTSTFAVGDNICFSAWCYVSPDWTGGSHMLHFERFSSGWAHYDLEKKGTWQLLQINHTVTASNLTGSPLRCLTYNSMSNTVAGSIIIADLRLTKVNMPTLGRTGGIWDHKMCFNLYRDYKIDFREDWTFSYWKRPISTHTGNTSGYSIDAIGYSGGKLADGTSSYYNWWGKPNNSDSISGAGGIDDMDTYWNQWRLIVVSHKKGDGTYITEVDEVKTYHRKLSGAFSKPDAATAVETDADIQLGGWQLSNVSTSIYRDITVGQVNKTQADAEAMFSEGLRLMTDGASINGELIERGL